MRSTDLQTYAKHSDPIAHAFFVAPGNKFWEVTLFYTHHVATLVRRWGKYGSKQPGLVLTYSLLHKAQTVFGQVTREKQYQGWTKLGENAIDRLAALTILDLPANPNVPSRRRFRTYEGNPCACEAYSFPHRPDSGGCSDETRQSDDDNECGSCGGSGGGDGYWRCQSCGGSGMNRRQRQEDPDAYDRYHDR